MRRFVVVVDMQRDFIDTDGALSVTGAADIVPKTVDWLARLHPDEVAGVLFTADTHVPAIYAASPEAAQFPPHCMAGTPGWELVVDPAVVDGAIPTYRLEKGVFDMWAEPGLTITRIDGNASVDRDAFFAGLRHAGIDEAIVIGVAADYCVRWAIDGLLTRGFHVTIPPSLTRGIARQIDAVVAEEWPGNAAVTLSPSA